MRKPYVSLLAVVVVLVCTLLSVAPAIAQRVTLEVIGGKPPEYVTPKAYDGNYNPRDFSGIWFRVGGDRSHGPARTHPPLTAAGLAELKSHKPSRSYVPELMPAVSDPKESNYPALRCNPKGFPAIKVDDNHDHHELIMLPDRMIEHWQEEGRLREVWMDGREVPSGDNLKRLGVSWMGMSVGHWENNTLVVEVVGLDGRAWLDTYGFPKSDDARFIERITHPAPDTLEIEYIMYDPTYYTAPWVSDIKTWKKEPRNARPVNNFGWYGLFSGLNDLICPPMNGSGDPSNPYGGD
jgi:hypothetical protein